jgi:HB1, ASXL, restriction endonuclease HTH domain
MDALEAALRVLREEAEPLHWTKIQDLALRRGYLDPFTTPDVRRHLLTALAEASRTGLVRKVERGVYALPGD